MVVLLFLIGFISAQSLNNMISVTNTYDDFRSCIDSGNNHCLNPYDLTNGYCCLNNSDLPLHSQTCVYGQAT